MENPASAHSPKPQLSYFDAIALVTGIVIGAGIFRTPSLVAQHTGDANMFMLAWVAGALISCIGALCYAELSSAFPNTGGDYFFIHKAFGPYPAFLFAWARMTVIQTGSVALLAYIFGDYMTYIYSLGPYSPTLYAAGVVLILTLINIWGIRMGTGTQKLLTLIEVIGVLLVIIAGLSVLKNPPAINAPASTSDPHFGLALVFVLLSFGGWNEAAYISAELKVGKKGMVRTLVISLVLISIFYLLINMAYLNVLGHSGVADSPAVGAAVMQTNWGDTGAWLIGMFVGISALTSANATLFTGARSNYALGKDFSIFSRMGRWNNERSGPVNALLVQGGIALLLVGLGLFSRSGFEAMIAYTAPVFWGFFLLVGIALFILRGTQPDVPRPFKVPFYPILPLLFCLSSAYLFYSSIMHAGFGALLGVGIMLLGVLLLYRLPRK